MRVLLSTLASSLLLALTCLRAPAQPQEAGVLTLLTPMQQLQACSQDAAALASQGQSTQYQRYLVFENSLQAAKVKRKKTVDFCLNSLNTYSPLPYLSTPVLDARGDWVGLRVDLSKYGISPFAWYRLLTNGSGSVPLPEPYFNVLVQKSRQVPWQGGTWRGDGKWYAANSFKYNERWQELVAAPWVTTDGGLAYARLAALTQSSVPIARADWFATYSLWAPAYYDLLGLDAKKGVEKDVQKLARADLKLSELTLLTAVTDSKFVTLHNRIIERYLSNNHILGGWYWRSRDTDTGIDREDYGNPNNLLKPVFKAQEIIFSLPCGLNAYALTDGKTKLINVAAAAIAKHKDTRLSDIQVFAGRNCVICHDTVDGFWKLPDRYRKLAQGQVGLFANLFHGHDDEVQKLLNSFAHDPDFLTGRDSQVYSAAVKAVTGGWTVKQNGRSFEDLSVGYLDTLLDRQQIALEAGYTWPVLEARLKTAAGLDHTLVGLTQNPPLGISRLNFERVAFAQLMTLMSAANPRK